MVKFIYTSTDTHGHTRGTLKAIKSRRYKSECGRFSLFKEKQGGVLMWTLRDHKRGVDATNLPTLKSAKDEAEAHIRRSKQYGI